MRRTLGIILALDALAVAVNVAVGVRIGALSVMGAGLESGLDMLNNVIGIVLAGVAARDPDEEHPYGHDKLETLGALAVVGFRSISCFELLREATAQLVRGSHGRRRRRPTSRCSS